MRHPRKDDALTLYLIVYYFTTRFLTSHVADSLSLQRYLNAKRTFDFKYSAGTAMAPEGT
jgi:hypothetical protein